MSTKISNSLPKAKPNDPRRTHWPKPPCHKPIKTKKDHDSPVVFYCTLCYNEYETADAFYQHNPCVDDDDTSDEDEDEDESDDDDTETEDEVDNPITAPWLPGGHQAYVARLNAEESLEFYNKLDGAKQYEFVEGGPCGKAVISRGPILHINFKAKEKGRPDAQVETFFAQLRIPNGYPVVDCCVTLGPSQDLPYWRKADVRGCKYCAWAVHHPAERCEKLMLGIKYEDVTWLYGDSKPSYIFDSDYSDDDLGL